jgi:DNA-binding beta-propeller fold protein YncE
MMPYFLRGLQGASLLFKIPGLSYTSGMRKISVLLMSLFFIQGLASQPREVLIRVFPTSFHATQEGVRLTPVAFRDEGKVYLLEEGPQLLRIEAPGYHSRRAVILAEETRWEGKLERSDSELRLFRTVSTGVQPKSVRFTPSGDFLVAPLLGSTGAEVFRFPSMEYVTRLSPPDKKEHAGFVESAFTPDGKEVWISQMGTNTVHRYSTADRSFLGSIVTTGLWGKVICFNQAGSRAYLSNWMSNDITEFNLEDGGQRLLAVGGTPRGLYITPDQKTLYATNFDNGNLIEVALPEFTLTKVHPWGGGALRHLAGRGSLMVASDMASGTLTWFDIQHEKILARRRIAPILNTLALVPGRPWSVVSSRGPNHPETYLRKGPEYGKVFLVDNQSYEILDWFWGGNQPTGLDVSPDGRFIASTDFLDHRIQIYEILRTE